MAQRHKLMVYLCSYAVASEEGVYGEGEVECSASCRHGLYLSLRCEHEDLRREEVELYGVEEVHGVGLWVVEYLLDGVQPLVEFTFVFSKLYLSSFLVFPVCCKSLFGYLVHLVRAYLYLYPSALFRHQCDVQCLVSVCLRVVEPVAQSVGMCFIYLTNSYIYIEALVYLVFAMLGREDDAHGEDVVYLLKRDVLVLHLVPNGERTFDALFDDVFHSHLVECLFDG